MLPESLTPADAITALALIMHSVPLTEKQLRLLDSALATLNVLVQNNTDTSSFKTNISN